MATVFHPTITEVGKQAALNAAGNGLELALTHIGFGAGAYTPTGNETLMANQHAKVAIASGARATPTQVRISASWQSDTGNYPITEIGIYAGNVLFAVYSTVTANLIGYKTAGVDFVFFYDFGLSALPSNSITVVADTNQSTALAALGSHIADDEAHPQYLLVTTFNTTTFDGGTY